MELTLTEPLSTDSITIVEPRINYGRPPSPMRKGLTSTEMTSGYIHSVNTGPTTVRGELSLRFLTPTEHYQLLDFFENSTKINFRFFNISITNPPATHALDLGKGRLDLTATGCKLGENVISLGELFEHKAPDIYHWVLPYIYVKDSQ